MLRILVALAVATAIFLVATTFSGTAMHTGPAQVTTLSGPERGVLRLVP
jgi:hypothetical protein